MKGRFERIAKAIPSGLDGVLLTSEANMLYASGIELECGYVVITPNDAVMLCDFRYSESAEKTGRLTVKPLEKDALPKLVNELKIKSLGYEDKKISLCEFNSVKEKLDGVELVPLGDTIDRVRAIKDQEEMSKIISAQKLADEAFNLILYKDMHKRMSEKEIACRIDAAMVNLGADGPAFTTIVLSGTKTSMPHGVPTKDGPLQRGFVTFDFGARLDGYRCDVTRTFVNGYADEEMKHVYNTVLQAQKKAMEAIKPDSTGREIDKVARDIIDREYPNSFGHATGHGVGLDIHEFPRLSVSADEKIGMWSVVTVEPGIYIPGKYGCRIEDTVIVSDIGAISTTLLPKELIEYH